MIDEATNSVEQCCNMILDVIDGKYGWFSEAGILIFLLIVVHVFVRALLKPLHTRYAAQKKYWQDGFVRGLYKPLSYYVWFLAIANTFDLVNIRINGKNFFQDNHMHQMMTVGAILAFGWFLMRWKDHVIESMILRSERQEIHMDRGKIDMMSKVGTMFIIFVTSLLLMETVGRSINTLIAFGGVGGLAIAFASQEIVANFFGGIMIYVTHPFAVGDWIHLPERDLEGHVEEIGWYMTRIRTFNKRPVYVPNSIFSKIVVVTPSRMSHRQFKQTIGVRYEDLPAVKHIIHDIEELLANHPDVDHNLNSMVHLHAFGSYAIEIVAEAYLTKVDTKGYTELHQELLFAVSDIISKYQAQMAYPTTYLQMAQPLPNQMLSAPPKQV